MNLRDITVSDIGIILKINEGSVKFLSPLTHSRIETLVDQSKYHKIIEQEGHIAAFILAFDPSANYDSPNFLWFKERYKSFLYIDRIVVDKEYRRKGLAKLLYDDIIKFASQNNYYCLTCEIDIHPPNYGSLQFHDKYKFVEVGTHWPYAGEKQVSLRERKL
jgi:uncharacterized protein